ncbi:MAG TPA: hypothetical protein H9783_03040 [Candidatus Limosilactobacillus faecipullorum]|nr:hypothetical protein [Candidatus Limosilactobacillus faecipullorum]
MKKEDPLSQDIHNRLQNVRDQRNFKKPRSNPQQWLGIIIVVAVVLGLLFSLLMLLI